MRKVVFSTGQVSFRYGVRASEQASLRRCCQARAISTNRNSSGYLLSCGFVFLLFASTGMMSTAQMIVRLAIDKEGRSLKER